MTYTLVCMDLGMHQNPKGSHNSPIQIGILIIYRSVNAQCRLTRLIIYGCRPADHQHRFYFTAIRRLIYNASQNSKTMEVRKK